MEIKIDHLDKNLPSIDSDQILVRDLCNDDVPKILDYWFHSPPGFIESLGVDTSKMPTEEEMEKALHRKIHENQLLEFSKLNALAIVYKNQAIGFHSINPITEGEFGIFHAHIWSPEMRRRSVGLHSYPKACKVFMKRFNLQKILFKTPVQNIGAIRVKEKLGIRCIGEEIIGFGIIKDGTIAKVFEWNESEIFNAGQNHESSN